MMPVDADGSSGATGMARDADTAAKPRQMANTEATITFMDLSLLFPKAAT
jgi:hypothetical protein